jgi:hypothetical protein
MRDGVDKNFSHVQSGLCRDIQTLSALENKYYLSSDKNERRQLRDHWLQIVTQDIDYLWWQFKNGFAGRQAGVKTGIETLAIGTGAGAAGVTGAAGKTGLAILSTTMTGLSTSFDKNILENNATSLVLATMEAERMRIDASIVAGMGLDDDHYNMAEASRDAWRYANAGSLWGALATLHQAVGQAGTNAATTRDNVAHGLH